MLTAWGEIIRRCFVATNFPIKSYQNIFLQKTWFNFNCKRVLKKFILKNSETAWFFHIQLIAPFRLQIFFFRPKIFVDWSPWGWGPQNGGQSPSKIVSLSCFGKLITTGSISTQYYILLKIVPKIILFYFLHSQKMHPSVYLKNILPNRLAQHCRFARPLAPQPAVGSNCSSQHYSGVCITIAPWHMVKPGQSKSLFHRDLSTPIRLWRLDELHAQGTVMAAYTTWFVSCSQFWRWRLFLFHVEQHF